MITVTMTSKFQASGQDGRVSAPELAEWLRHIPSNATLTPVFVERGHQRDSYKVFVGITATWTETR